MGHPVNCNGFFRRMEVYSTPIRPVDPPAGGIHNRPLPLGDRGPASAPLFFAKYPRFPTPGGDGPPIIKTVTVKFTVTALSWII